MKIKQFNIKSWLFMALCFMVSCSESESFQEPDKDESDTQTEAPQQIKIAVFSDTHLMDPQLLISEGSAFETYINHDRKMLKESTAILDELLNKLENEKPDIVLVPGDLTKDGAESSHLLFANNYLSTLKKRGAKIFVVPGNHDINNPHAVSFDGDSKTRVKSVSKDEFANIYGEYGYNNAIAKDNYSLTYVAEPFSNLRILGIDACKYEENNFTDDICVTAGAIKPQTMEFIRAQAADAKAKNIRLIAVMHHGLIEHWKMQETLMAEYLIDNWRTYADEFAELGIQLTFTGHFHAQDIVKHETNTNFAFDIETGSMVTYPCPFRLATISDNSITIESKFIKNINYNTQGKEFPLYAKEYVESGIGNLILGYLPLPENVVNIVMPLASNAIIAHYTGDEQIDDAELKKINSVAMAANIVAPGMGDFLKNAALGLWTDLKPADNNITINLITGETK
ncbi:MAG: metallophosphoesterase family protein [Marinifilaceae bacterium]